MTDWSIQNIKGHLPTEVWETFLNHDVIAFGLAVMVLLSFSYPFTHQVYLKHSEKYRDQLNQNQQLVVIHHTVEAVFLSIIWTPFTYVILSVNFQKQEYESLKTKLTAVSIMMLGILTMYLLEIGSRFATLRPLVAIHHLCVAFNGLLALHFVTTATVRSSTLLIYFVTFEAVTFIGLVLYRLAPTHRATRPIILAGMIIFGLSRPVQFVWIVGGLWVNWEDLVIWQAVVQIVLTCVFTSLQMYSLTIHYQLYKKCCARRTDIQTQQKSTISVLVDATLNSSYAYEAAKGDIEQASSDSLNSH